jgi:SAM-dependent methyltransferase
MRLLDRWLNGLAPSARVLDLGCGAGSLRIQLAGLNVVGVDVDANEFPRSSNHFSAHALSHQLPFADQSFDLVVCNHSLEHILETQATVIEIHRVLKHGGRLFVTVPDGKSFSDRLYRLLFCGGGHLQRFTFESIICEIESSTQLHLAGWKELSSSFIFVDRRNFLPAPLGPLSARSQGGCAGWASCLHGVSKEPESP